MGQGVRPLRSVPPLETTQLIQTHPRGAFVWYESYKPSTLPTHEFWCWEEYNNFCEAKIIRILITYANAGAGHRRAAEAIAQAAAAAYPTADVQCHDLLAHVPGLLRRAYPWSYYLLVRYLSLFWGGCFALLDTSAVYALVRPIRRAWNLLLAQGFIRWLRAQPPDLVVATHFLPADVCGSGKQAGWLQAPLAVVITDLHPHRFWLAPEADAVVVATPETALTCERRGIPPNRVHVLGIPIAGAFHAPVDRASLHQRLGLAPHRQTIVVTSGGTTVGPFEAVVRALMDVERTRPGRLQLLVVCGENTRAAERLHRLAQACAMPVQVFGFVDNMPELMGASDLVVAKAGGLTVMEALGRGLPLVLYHAIPGQEGFNAQYVVRHGAAVIARTPRDVVRVVERYFDDPQGATRMREAAVALSRPNAAEAIVSHVIGPLLAHAIT